MCPGKMRNINIDHGLSTLKYSFHLIFYSWVKTGWYCQQDTLKLQYLLNFPKNIAVPFKKSRTN